MNENIVYDFLNSLLPLNRKHTPSGWTSFNGPCCIHNGAQRKDKKKRAGLIMNLDGHVTYHCFNCGFKAAWTRGKPLSGNMRKLFSWFGATDDEIKKVVFKLFQVNSALEAEGAISPQAQHQSFTVDFKEVPMPKGAKPFSYWAESNLVNQDFLAVANYVANRGDEIFNNPREYWWTPDKAHNMHKRVIIPFYWRNKIVGWTCRTIDPKEKNRYYSEQQPNYLYNNEAMFVPERKFILLVEGPFDAISIDGVATLGAKISKQQIDWLNRSGKEIIVVPDRDLRSRTLIDAALENGWAVSYPWGKTFDKWDREVKDAADAVKKYGRLYTVRTIIENKTANKVKIETYFNMLKSKVVVKG